MRINKKILAGITAVSMLTCGIWMESVFAADTFSAEGGRSCIGYCDGSVGRIYYRGLK